MDENFDSFILQKYYLKFKARALYIINSVRNCISSKRSFVYHYCERVYSLRLMIYTPNGVMICKSLCDLVIYHCFRNG